MGGESTGIGEYTVEEGTMSKEISTVVMSGPVSIESYADNINAKLQVASILLKSGMAPAHYKSPEAVLGAVLYGRELGFSPIRALHAINVIQGKPTLSAEGLKALAIQHGGKIQTVEWTSKACTLKCSRGDWVEQCTFSIEDAQLQGLTSKDNWKRMPKAMLYARCVSTLVRNMFADVIGGLYSYEEMRDSAQEKPNVVREEGRVIDVGTGEVIEDDIPESFAPNATAAEVQKVKDLIEAEDLSALGNHVISTKCSIQGMTVQDAIQENRGLVEEKLKYFKEADRMALQAFLDATKSSSNVPDLTPLDLDEEELNEAIRKLNI